MPEPDERYELVLEQAMWALKQQQDALDNLRARAGTMIAAASIVSSFLGAATLNARPSSMLVLVLTIIAISAFTIVVVSVSLIVWPQTWRWGIDVHRLLADYVESTEPADLDEFRRSLAYHMGEDVAGNQKRLNRLWVGLQVAVIALGVEVASWTTASMVR